MSELEIYAVLVRETEPMLRGYVTSLVRDRSLVDDIVQEAFLHAHRNFSSLQKTSSFGSWIRSIARNVAWQELAKRNREAPWDPEMILGMEDVIGAFDDPVRGDSWRERVKLVERCFDDLADLLKHPCRLFYFENRTTEAIGGVLGIAPATARKRLERARVAIKDCVEVQIGLEHTAG